MRLLLHCAFLLVLTSGCAQTQKPEMVLISGGSFMMGQSDGEGDEQPVHKVELDDFLIGKYEISVREYRRFCYATNRIMPEEPEQGWNPEHPIMNITWYDAMDYIRWLNAALNENYRLPTESEFEYVIRNGGKSGTYPWGNGLPANENIADETLAETDWSRGIWKGYNDGYAKSSAIGKFEPNELGVHDINGNVWEWCHDWYGDYPDTTMVKNPEGPLTGTHKVGRGASFHSDPWHSRSASRSWVKPTFKGPGFRLAKDVDNR